MNRYFFQKNRTNPIRYLPSFTPLAGMRGLVITTNSSFFQTWPPIRPPAKKPWLLLLHPPSSRPPSLPQPYPQTSSSSSEQYQSPQYWWRRLKLVWSPGWEVGLQSQVLWFQQALYQFLKNITQQAIYKRVKCLLARTEKIFGPNLNRSRPIKSTAQILLRMDLAELGCPLMEKP